MLKNRCALITGASSGLGKALALECAARHIDLVLIALPDSGLSQLADFIKRNYEIKVYPIEKNLSSASACKQVYNQVTAAGINIHILINNAGVGGTFLFDERNTNYYQNIININVIVPVLLTRLFIHQLLQHDAAYILNVGSMSAYFSLPMKQVYAATKSFLLSFTTALQSEFTHKNVKVSIVCPGGMNTNIHAILNNRSGSWVSRQSIMNPEDVASIAMNGLFKGKQIIIPGRWNRFFLFADNLLPGFLKRKIIRWHMQSLRIYNRKSTATLPQQKALNADDLFVIENSTTGVEKNASAFILQGRNVS